jgi:hypothetical protein
MVMEPGRSSAEEPDFPMESGGDVGFAPPRLSPHQRALWQALKEQGEGLSRMYLGALAVLRHADNPDRLPQAAHSMRELIEKLPAAFGLQMRPNIPLITERVRGLYDSWRKVCANSECYDSGNWVGEVDRILRKWLQELPAFFDQFNEQSPSRRGRLAAALQEFDDSAHHLPDRLINLNAKYWHELWQFFEDVCHHGRRDTTPEAFDQWLYALEKFLLDRLRPRTFDEMDTLDAIIEEGESDA